jgi:hypothetical protein
METVMKRTVNIKALLILGGIILSLGLIYLVGYLLPPSFQLTSGVYLFNGGFWDNIINGLGAVAMFGLAICVIVLVVIGVGSLIGWIFPKKKLG